MEMHKVPLPPGMPKTNYRAPLQALVPSGIGELPLIDDKTPEHKRIQERLRPRVRVFDLSNKEDVEDLEKVWQSVCDGVAKISEEQTNFDPERGRYLTMLRWSDIEYNVPADT